MEQKFFNDFFYGGQAPDVQVIPVPNEVIDENASTLLSDVDTIE